MAAITLILGPRWEDFVEQEIASGRYASASEVIRAALRELEQHGKRLDALRTHLDEGAKQARRGGFVHFDLGDVVARAKMRVAGERA